MPYTVFMHGPASKPQNKGSFVTRKAADAYLKAAKRMFPEARFEITDGEEPRQTMTTYRRADGQLICGEFTFVFDFEFFDEALDPVDVIQETWVLESSRPRRLPESAVELERQLAIDNFEADVEDGTVGTDQSGNPLHTHTTRDIKPVGQCPACDAYHRSSQTAS